jgi:hypothetical protein
MVPRDVNGSVTVRTAVPERCSLVAVITAIPGPVAVASPVLETLTTFGLLVDHETTRLVRGLPPLSIMIVVSCCDVPAAILGCDGVTSTATTAAGAPPLPAGPVGESISPSAQAARNTSRNRRRMAIIQYSVGDIPLVALINVSGQY